MKKKVVFIFILVLAFIMVLTIILLSLNSPYQKASDLTEAINAQNIDLVNQLLAEGVDPNQTNIPASGVWSFWEMSADRPICCACYNGNLEIIKMLIDHGATVDDQDNTGWSPLREVLFFYDSDDVEIVKLLLENGADPELIESDYNSIFAAADMYPYSRENKNRSYESKTAEDITTIVQLLLADRSVNIQTEYGKTLLMLAAKRGNLHLVQYLLESGCDPTMTDWEGKTAADYAIAAGAEEVVDILKIS